uniref:AT23701p n=1 Tax=Drosophila melanogaster TaxID=7227 RepID=Q9VNB1_DROME|nr:uncharacterized protein Dmel_CG14668 [Drosophila melanogaster]AAF52035.2 uncharacterized protein Dmel_CG14668 [Drosophila melanogaster]AAT94527.1 AT23701p [Drosophila melanogaster]|eukprot:NP_649533.1 uncharacterized protein Dmel_CG14668 [Drosophila melanogaster]
MQAGNSATLSKKSMAGGTAKRTQAVAPTFEVTQLSSSQLSSNRGVQLPPLMMRGQTDPDQVENATFRVVQADRRPISDQQFNTLIKRLVKCFMSEVAITKRLQKAISKRSVNPVERQLIRHMEALLQKYEAERSALVVNLSLDTRFKRCHPLAAQLVGVQPSRSSKLQKSNPLENDKAPKKTTSRKNEHDIRRRQRQSGGSLPKGSIAGAIVGKRLRLQETFKSYPEPHQIEKPSPGNQNRLVSVNNDVSAQVSPSSSDVFYDFPDIVEF